MSLWKRGRQYWMDVTVNGQRYRDSLGTTDWREAKAFEKERIAMFAKRPPDTGNQRRTFEKLDVSAAISAYAAERHALVSPRMVAYWKENARPLGAFFGRQAFMRSHSCGPTTNIRQPALKLAEHQRPLMESSLCCGNFCAARSSGIGFKRITKL